MDILAKGPILDWKNDGKQHERFKSWNKTVETFCEAMEFEKKEAKLISLCLKHWSGERGQDLITASGKETWKDRLKVISDACQPRGSTLVAAAEYKNLSQGSLEIPEFITKCEHVVKQLGITNAEAQDTLIRNAIMLGLSSKQMYAKCLDEDKQDELTSKRVKEIALNIYKADAQQVIMQSLSNPSSSGTAVQGTPSVNAAYRDPTKRSQKNGGKHKGKSSTKRPQAIRSSQSNSKKECPWCAGDLHPREKCPAKHATCNHCHSQGHFEKACFKKKRAGKKSHQQDAVDVYSSSDSECGNGHDIGSVYIGGISTKTPREALATVEFDNAGISSTLQGKVDTGAMVSCMPLSMLSSIGLNADHLQPSNVNLRGASGVNLQNCGTLETEVICNNIRAKVTIYITKSGHEFLLGLGFCKKFKLVNIAASCIQRNINVDDIEAVHITDESAVDYHKLKQKWAKHLPLGKKSGDPLTDLQQIFPTMFDGTVGLFEGEVNLKLSPEAQPVQLPPRAVPQSILPQLKKELDQMEQEGIIRPCPETTEWVHNLVNVVKKNGSLRVCLDPRNLNKYLIRSVHYTASWEDAVHSFRNGQFFSTLDAKSGYWTQKLSEESQILTAFNTPFKKYCFVRMPFGLSCASEIFCEHMDRALDGIPGTFPCADDVKVQGSTEERHDIHLLETVTQAKKAGLKFNPQKCVIKQKKIEYFGRVISPEGIEPCPKKVKGIHNLQAPKDKQELQSFLGSINFLSTFIPNLAKKTFLMKSLLKKDIRYVWTSDMQKEFDIVKKAVATAMTLNHYDPNKPVVIDTDASLKGLGAVLIQDGKPIRFLSKALTATESGYANIERELLAVLFACEKLHNYTFGRETTIHTDHKPLENIFQKPISLAPARLQRMLLRLSIYNITVKYVGAKSVLLADTLSRLVKPGSGKQIQGLDVTIAEVLKVKRTRLQQLQEETKSDITLIALSDLIMSGWPNSMQDVPANIHPYWCFRDELTILNGLVMKGNRVVIPANVRADTLNFLHDAHQGLNSTLQRARRTVYWPNMAKDIEDLTLQCEECQRFSNKKPRHPERQISTTRAMEVLGMDIMKWKSKPALVTVDYFSGLVTYDPLKDETAEEVINTLNNLFSKIGLAETIISDNGPCFKSDKFQEFCDHLNIDHPTSSPHYHQSNGRAERAIQTIEKILKKAKKPTDITNGIITYMDTPIDDKLPTPGELFFNRRINTRLGNMYHPSSLTDIEKTQLTAKRSQHLKPPSKEQQYHPGQPIWFTEDRTEEWKPGYIESKDIHPDSYWIVNEASNRRIRRNKHDLKPRIPVAIQQAQPIQPPPSPGNYPLLIDIPPKSPPTDSSPDVPEDDAVPSATPSPFKTKIQKTSPPKPRKETSDVRETPVTKTRSGRTVKDSKKSDYVY